MASRRELMKEEPGAVDPPRRFLFIRPDPTEEAGEVEIEQYVSLKRAKELDAKDGWRLLREIAEPRPGEPPWTAFNDPT